MVCTEFGSLENVIRSVHPIKVTIAETTHETNANCMRCQNVNRTALPGSVEAEDGWGTRKV